MKAKKEKTERGIWRRMANYSEDGWEYLKESRWYVYGTAMLFFASIFVGFVFSEYFGFYSDILRWMINSTSNLRGADLSVFIFFSNFKSAFFALFLGMLAVGAFSVFNVLLNGSLLGYVLSLLWVDSGIAHFWRLLPHGIFEIPALFISWGLGVKLGMFIFKKNTLQELKKRFENSLKTFFFIVVPLLIIAAIIESLFIIFSV